MIFFVYEIDAHEAITASSTVFYKVTIATIFRVCGVITPKTLLTIETLVENLRIVDITTIDDILGALDELAIIASFAVLG